MGSTSAQTGWQVPVMVWSCDTDGAAWKKTGRVVCKPYRGLALHNQGLVRSSGDTFMSAIFSRLAHAPVVHPPMDSRPSEPMCRALSVRSLHVAMLPDRLTTSDYVTAPRAQRTFRPEIRWTQPCKWPAAGKHMEDCMHAERTRWCQPSHMEGDRLIHEQERPPTSSWTSRYEAKASYHFVLPERLSCWTSGSTHGITCLR